jgi:hypothetical protein
MCREGKGKETERLKGVEGTGRKIKKPKECNVE